MATLRVVVGVLLTIAGTLLLLFEIGMAFSESYLLRHLDAWTSLIGLVVLGCLMIFVGYRLTCVSR